MPSQKILESHYSGKTVLITGGASFLGQYLTNRLLDLDADVEIITSNRFRDMSTLVWNGRLRPDQIYKTDLTNNYPNITWDYYDHVFHTASVVGNRSKMENNPFTYYYQNGHILYNILQSLLDSRDIHESMPQFNYISSMNVFSKTTMKIIKATTPIYSNTSFSKYYHADTCLDPYAFQKVYEERVVSALHAEKLNYTITRLGSVFGPRQFDQPENLTLVTDLIYKMLIARDTGRIVEVKSPIDTQIRPIYIDDAIEGLLIAAIQQNKIMNYPGLQTTTIRKLIDEIGAVINYKPKIEAPVSEVLSEKFFHSFLTKVGFSQRWSLSDALRQSIDWYTKHWFN